MCFGQTILVGVIYYIDSLNSCFGAKAKKKLVLFANLFFVLTFAPSNKNNNPYTKQTMETTFTLPEANTVKTISQLCEILNQCEELPVFWVEDVCANNSWELLEPSNTWDERDLCTDGTQYVTLDDNGEFNYYYNNEKA